MEEYGIFTMTLRLVRRSWDLFKTLYEYLTTHTGGIVQELILLGIVCFIVPKLVDLAEWLIKGIIAALRLFE